MNHILFLNEWEGLGFLLKKRLQKESPDTVFFNLRDNSEEFKKYKIRSSPILLVLDKDEIVDKISSVEEIIEYLKNQE